MSCLWTGRVISASGPLYIQFIGFTAQQLLWIYEANIDGSGQAEIKSLLSSWVWDDETCVGNSAMTKWVEGIMTETYGCTHGISVFKGNKTSHSVCAWLQLFCSTLICWEKEIQAEMSIYYGGKHLIRRDLLQHKWGQICGNETASFFLVFQS